GRERVLIDRTPCQADPPTRGGRGAPLRCATRSPTNSPRVRGTGVVGVRVRATARPILPACGGRGGTPWLCGGAGARSGHGKGARRRQAACRTGPGHAPSRRAPSLPPPPRAGEGWGGGGPRRRRDRPRYTPGRTDRGRVG